MRGGWGGSNSVVESTFSFLLSSRSLGHLQSLKDHKNLPRTVTWKEISRWKSNLICSLPPQNYACKSKTRVPLSCPKILSDFDSLCKKLQRFTSKGFSIKSHSSSLKALAWNTTHLTLFACRIVIWTHAKCSIPLFEQWSLHFASV